MNKVTRLRVTTLHSRIVLCLLRPVEFSGRLMHEKEDTLVHNNNSLKDKRSFGLASGSTTREYGEGGIAEDCSSL